MSLRKLMYQNLLGFYLRSDSTTVLACLSRPQNFATRVMLFKKGSQKISVLSCLKKDDFVKYEILLTEKVALVMTFI